jgi:predicted RNA-binding Zn ribbon-like protein
VHGATLAAALVNTRPRRTNAVEALPDADAAVRLLAAHGLPVPHEEAAAALPALHRLRDELLAAFTAPDMPALAAALNPYLERAPAARLIGADGRWTVGAPEDALPLADRVALRAARGLAELAASAGLDRLGICAADDCLAVYADTSPRGARRYCSRTCSTRMNVRRHRASAH